MQFAIVAHDGKNMLEKRLRVRPRHLENMSRVKGRVLCAGGILDDEGRMAGSVIVLDVPSREQLVEYLASEPYIAEGVWEKVTVEKMNVVILDGEKLKQ